MTAVLTEPVNISVLHAEPTAILVAGDVHGDPGHLVYLFEQAMDQNVDAIVQVGDYGFWEHMPGGSKFLDLTSELWVATGNDGGQRIPFYWIDGNHENHTWLRARYGPGGNRYKPTPEGFWEIRPGCYYIPRGMRWQWSGRHLMGLGGAYSVDKAYRLKKQVENQELFIQMKGYDPGQDRFAQWWAEEELTDEEVALAIVDRTPLDVLFTHDKPLASTPGWNRKAWDVCLPNQRKIQTVVNTLQPRMLIHGHLHHRYSDEIRCGDDGKSTYVEGLDCNPDEDHPVDPRNSWVRLSLVG